MTNPEEDMVERVARAIAKAHRLDTGEFVGADGARHHVEPWRDFIDHARAAIEAMREPTEAMKRAGDDVQTVSEIENVSVPSLIESEDVWGAMITAALKQAAEEATGEQVRRHSDADANSITALKQG